MFGLAAHWDRLLLSFFARRFGRHGKVDSDDWQYHEKRPGGKPFLNSVGVEMKRPAARRGLLVEDRFAGLGGRDNHTSAAAGGASFVDGDDGDDEGGDGDDGVGDASDDGTDGDDGAAASSFGGGDSREQPQRWRQRRDRRWDRRLDGASPRDKVPMVDRCFSPAPYNVLPAAPLQPPLCVYACVRVCLCVCVRACVGAVGERRGTG